MAQAATKERTKQVAPTLDTVKANAQTGVQAMRERTAKAAEQTSRLQQISEELEGAIKERNLDRVAILTSDYATARASYQSNGRDLATAMVGLVTGVKDIGVTLQALQVFTPEEQQIIDGAQEMVTTIEKEIKDLTEARVVFRRASKLEDANKRLATAQTGIEPAKQLAEQKKRERLQKMQLEQALQMLQTMTTQAAQITREGISEMEENLEVMRQGGEQLMQDLQQLSKDVEGADQKIHNLSSELATMRDRLDELTQNSSEWISLKSEIADKERELSEAETERNQAFALYQDGQRFVEQYRVQETGQREALSFSQSWIALLETGVAHRTEIFESHLGLIRSAANMEAMEMLDAVAVETDERLTEDAARFSAASRNRMMERLKRAPDDVRRLRDITQVNEESRAMFERDLGDLLEKFHENWGSDPHYDDRARQPTGATAGAA